MQADIFVLKNLMQVVWWLLLYPGAGFLGVLNKQYATQQDDTFKSRVPAFIVYSFDYLLICL